MSIPISVVISCAGVGQRLGLSKTKALAHIHGRPIIAWQLDALRWVKDLRIVVGYQASEVIDCVKKIRDDVIFAFNHEYSQTGTAASFVAGALGAKGLVVSLDGDLLVCPIDLKNFIQKNSPSLGVLSYNTDEPLEAILDSEGKEVVAFMKDAQHSPKTFEWSGLCQVMSDQIEKSKNLNCDKGHVYELIKPHLPLPAVQIDAREIDTSSDFERAEQWLKSHSHKWNY